MTLSIDCKVGKQKVALIATGSDDEGYTALVAEGDLASTEDAYTTLTCDLEKGQTVTFIGVATNVPVYSITVEEKAAASTPETPSESGSGKFSLSSDKKVANIGDEISVDFNLSDNPGLQNFTGYIVYDADVLQLESFESGLAGVGSTFSNLTGVPTSESQGYEYLEDGNTKTAAELGKVKVTYNNTSGSNPVEIPDANGVLFTAKFKAVGNGSTSVSYVPVNYYNASNQVLGFENPENIDTIVVGDVDDPDIITAGTLELVPSATEFEKANQEFDVDLKVSNNPGFNNFTFFINYDPSVVELVGFEKGIIELNDAFITKVPTNGVEGYEALEDGNTKTAAKLGKVKVTYYHDQNKTISNITENGVLATLKFVTVGEGQSKIEYEPVSYIYAYPSQKVDFTFKSTSVKVASSEAVPFETETIKMYAVAVDGTEIKDVDADGNVTSKTYSFKKPDDNKVRVQYVITNNTLGIGNYKFYIDFDPEEMEAAAITSLAKDFMTQEEAEQALNYVPSPGNKDFDGFDADGVKTAGQLGRIVIAGMLLDADSTGITGDITTVEVEYTVKDEITKSPLTITIPGVDEDNSIVGWGVAKDVASGNEAANRTIEVEDDYLTVELDEVTGDALFAAVAGDNLKVSTSEDGTKTIYTLSKEDKDFTVSFVYINNPGTNQITAYIKYDPTLVNAKEAVKGSTLFPVDVINDAINYVPSADNADFAGLGADGVKTAGELGLIKIVNVLYEADGTLTESDEEELALVKFERVSDIAGETDIALINIETSRADLSVIDVDYEDITVTIEGEEAPEYGYHLLGNVAHDENGDINSDDALSALILSRGESEDEVEINITDVDGDGQILSDDALAVLIKSREDSYTFSRTEGVYAVGSEQYVQVPAEFAESDICPQITLIF
jgi:hypothetical protein